MNAAVDSGFKMVIDQFVQRRQDYLAGLKSGSSIVKITYRDKQLTCVYMRHTIETISVMTVRQVVNYLFNNGTLCLSGSATKVIIKFNLNEIQISNG